MKHIFLSILLVLLFAACQKDTNAVCTDGVIRWGGEPAVDGLGWYYQSEDLPKSVKLKNLSTAWQKDGLQVQACIIKLDEKYQCFCAEPMDVYQVKSIRQR